MIKHVCRIPTVDEQVGLVQSMLCDRSDKAHQNACHLLEGTICHLLNHCGDHQNRFVNCSFDFNMSAVVPTIYDFFWKHKWIAIPFFLSMPMMIALAVLPELL